MPGRQTIMLFCYSFTQISEVSRSGNIIIWDNVIVWSSVGISSSIVILFSSFISDFICLTSFLRLCHFVKHWCLGEVVCAKAEAADDDDWWQSGEWKYSTMQLVNCVGLLMYSLAPNTWLLPLLVNRRQVFRNLISHASLSINGLK